VVASASGAGVCGSWQRGRVTGGYRARAYRQGAGYSDELDELGEGLRFARPRQLYYAAEATVWLPGKEERAEREALEAVDAYEHAEQAERAYADEAVARAVLALARAGRGELDGARAALQPVLDLPPRSESPAS
jgi:hypothetical protein